jgi:hypothetical protein
MVGMQRQYSRVVNILLPRSIARVTSSRRQHPRRASYFTSFCHADRVARGRHTTNCRRQRRRRGVVYSLLFLCYDRYDTSLIVRCFFLPVVPVPSINTYREKATLYMLYIQRRAYGRHVYIHCKCDTRILAALKPADLSHVLRPP